MKGTLFPVASSLSGKRYPICESLAVPPHLLRLLQRLPNFAKQWNRDDDQEHTAPIVEIEAVR